MTRNRRKWAGLNALRKGMLCATVLACPLFLAPALVAPATASYFLPENYFQTQPVDASAQMVIEANSLEYDDSTNIVTARGQVRMFYEGYAIVADLVSYDRNDETVRLQGNVRIREPGGNIYLAEQAEFTGGFRSGFINSLKVETTDSKFIIADSVTFEEGSARTYEGVKYAPCGICLEDPEVPIGWRIKAAKIVHDQVEQTIHFTHATLEVLGVPIITIPYLSLPDPSRWRDGGLFQTRLSYSEKLGIGLETDFSVASGKNYNVTLSPKLMSEQGLLFSGQWEQLLDAGSYRVRLSAIHQLSPENFAGQLGDRDFRASLRTDGKFSLAPDWSVGWDYTRFTDAAFLNDYDLTEKDGRTTNKLYVSHFSKTASFSASLYEDVLLGEVSQADQDKQLRALPAVDYEQYFDLDDQGGRVTVKANILSASRDLDDATTIGGVERVYGFAGTKTHARAEVSWKKQWIAPGGVLVTPYLGFRADWAQYDQDSMHPSAPAVPSLLSATPIAALDVRWPLGGRSANAYHLLEPIFQISARSNSSSLVGITNDVSQGLAFDPTNLFSFDRFAGFDRRETGVRANIGARYSVLLDDGGWYEASLGQSFQVAGDNAYADADPSLTGLGTGLETSRSDFVAGFVGKPNQNLTLRGQVNLKSNDLSVRRAFAAAAWQQDKFSAQADYSLIKAEPALGTTDDLHAFGVGVGFPVFADSTATLNYSVSAATPSTGVTKDQHAIGGSLSVPLSDYLTGTIATQYDIDDGSFSKNSIGLTYDDNYVLMGAEYTHTGPTDADNPDEHRFQIHFRLSQLGGFDAMTTGDSF